jgi:2-polyprenyl-3-methyl-5-hydroxy-6-metoxy-1,4-benzoquinol methylase
MPTARPRLTAATKTLLRHLIPLPARKALAIGLGRRSRLPQREWWTTELLRDYAERDVDGYHRFLWSNHLAYASTYEVAQRFGDDRLHPSRRYLLEMLPEAMAACGLPTAEAVGSVLDVGCSMGYLLHHLERHVFPAAAVLDGIDVDRYATETGAEHLRSRGSRISLRAGDLRELDRMLGGRCYDVTLCAGVLMYLTEADAAEAVRTMLDHTRGMLVLTGPAHPDVDNARLPRSEFRDPDRSLIHNLDSMVQRAGGAVRVRRWEGPRSVGGNTVYFLFCTPAPRAPGPAAAPARDRLPAASVPPGGA